MRRFPSLCTAAVLFFLSGFIVFPQENDEFPVVSEEDGNGPIDFEDPFADSGNDDEINFDDPFGDSASDEGLDFEDPFGESPEAEDPPISDTNPESGTNEELPAIDDFDSMFMNDEMIEELDESENILDAADELLESDEPSWGGRFSGALNFSWGWENYPVDGVFRESDSDSLSPELSSSLYIDARPDKNFRVFAKMDISAEAALNLADLGIDTSAFSFETDEDGNLVIAAGGDEEDPDAEEEEEEDPEPSAMTLSFAVRELFSDFNWNEILFFRFGKSFIKWGAGYFWSPADVLNLTSIDTENPTAERQGPLNLKVNLPVFIHNAYLFVIADAVEEYRDIALAPKMEFVLGDYEIGLGGFYQYDKPPRIISTLTGSLWDFSVFAEATVSFGSDRIFVRKSRNQPVFAEDQDTYVALDTFKVDLLPFFSGTAGFMYMNDDWNMNLMGQYFFNGEGYPDTRFEDGTSLLDAAAYLSQNSGSNGLSLPAAEQPDDYIEPETPGFSDLMNFGQHYTALMVSFSEIFDTDLGFSIFWLSNFTDMSGIISPNLTYKLFDKCTLALNLRFTYGEPGDEYTNPAALQAQDAGENPQVPTFELGVNISLGGGGF